MTARFGVDAGIATKNVIWDLHRPANKAAAANTEVLFLVTDAFGNVGRFVGGIQSMRQAAPGISIAGIRTPNGIQVYLLLLILRSIICNCMVVVSVAAVQLLTTIRNMG
jgi:hypothetical protein